MGPNSVKDGSPSASSTFLPPFRHSRRGSLASLASTNQLDKDSLSQALDQIHSTASQSERLTAFNEYTSPPPSASGPDPKGIASELQGGLSGLYSRLRASVGGSAKDVASARGEDGDVDVRSLSSSKAATKSPTTVSNETFETSKSSNTPANARPAGLTTSLAQQHPRGIREEVLQIEKDSPKLSTRNTSTAPSTKSAGDYAASFKSPPATLTQSNKPSKAGPALAEVNISAFREYERQKNGVQHVRNVQNASRNMQTNPVHALQDLPMSVDNGLVGQGNLRVESKADHKSKFSAQDGIPLGTGNLKSPLSGPIKQDSISTFPVTSDTKANNLGSAASDLSSDIENTSTLPPKIVTSLANGQDDVFSIKDGTSERPRNQDTRSKSRYQHLDLPLRKSIAPPLISKPDSDHPSLSRVSSSGTNTDSLASSVPPIHPKYELVDQHHSREAKIAGSRPIDIKSIPSNLRPLNVVSQVKNKVLNKEYWMKDQNAKDCFYCGDTFSTFRRKHHCRTCGQIFDAKCTSLIPGRYFDQAGTLRVCKPCERIVLGEDDSSEFSDDGTSSLRGMRPRHGSSGAGDVFDHSPMSGASPPGRAVLSESPKHPDLSVPTMTIPATRKAGRESSRKPTVLEIDAQRTLARPSSSRSLKSSFANKAYHPSHRRHNSRHLLQRGFKTVDEDSAPFHQDDRLDKLRSRGLPAFHDDSIIDPDLAPYLSDEASSGEEQVSIMAALSGDGLSRSQDNERHGFSRLANAKNGRSRIGEKSTSGVTFASRDADSQSLHSSGTANVPRSSKRRNVSISGNIHLRPSPRNYRASVTTPTLGPDLHEIPGGSSFSQSASLGSPAAGARMIRSSSMRGAAAPPIELNNASLLHVRKLLHQLLQDSDIPNIAGWEKALMPILLRATDDVNPDVQNGDDIDIRHYVKLKKIPGGRPGDTLYVSGLVFTKNLALKSMPRSISHPRILILTFALEYARHQQHFMSIDPIIRQEREYLQNVVNRIAALRPQLLLVERNVSGLALEFLARANIATAYNVKASVLEAVSRCCQTRIISSMDKLAVKPAQAGKCASFYLKTYVNEKRKKTYMFLSGCAKELGCTLVLRGDSDSVLAKMKRITEFMIYVVYNLKLETCLMRDEFAAIPSSLEIGSMAPGKDPTRGPFQALVFGSSQDAADAENLLNANVQSDSSHQERRASVVGALQNQTPPIPGTKGAFPALPEEDSVPEDIPMPTFYTDMVEEHKTKILSASPFVKFMQPYLLMRAREQERRLAYLKRLRDQDNLEEQNLDEKAKPEKFDLIKPEMVHQKVHAVSRKVREVLHAVHDDECDKALHRYQTQSKQWEVYIAGNVNMFDPYAHQNIAVLYSLVCTVTTVPCSGPEMLSMSYYNEHETDADFQPDCTLGQYVEDLCVGANAVCTSNGCERKMLEHHRQYVHGEAQLSVFVEHYPSKLRGLQHVILMWSTCRICGRETQTLPMSESTYKYSFAKYLELSFWSSDLKARADVCPHDLHRNHLRYFGFHDMAVRVQYDPITLLEIIVPRARIAWKVDNDLRFKNELFTKIETRMNKFMLSVRSRIKSINTESVLPEKIESCREEVEKLTRRASDEHQVLVNNLREKYMNSKHYEIIPLNRTVRAVQEKVAEWDKTFADFDRDFFPSEKDIRRLATLQLKKIFLDRGDSITSLTSLEDESGVSLSEQVLNEKDIASIPALAPQTRRMSTEDAHNLLTSVVEKQVSIDVGAPDHQSAPTTAVPNLETTEPSVALQDLDGENFRHLDLAISSEQFQEGYKPLSERPNHTDSIESVSANSTPILSQAQSSAHPEIDPSDLHAFPIKGSEPSSQAPKKDESGHVSGIPRPVEGVQRMARGNLSPTLSRAQSQPAHLRNERSSSSQSSKTQSPRVEATHMSSNTSNAKAADKKLSDRLGITALKQTGLTAQSMIPRSIASRRKDSKVSNLAKHFEQLSREFEKERLRERRERAARSRQARAYPMAASKPIVQVYRNVHEAVEERDPSDEDLSTSFDPSHTEREGELNTIQNMAENTDSQTPGDGFHAEETTAENTETDDKTLDSHAGSDAEEEGRRSDGDRSILDEGTRTPGTVSEDHELTLDDAQLDLKLDLPKHEKTSLMKMLTNFWAERSASGWQPLEYPLNATDHIFADSDIIVREDEPSSLIAFALGSEDYQAKLAEISQRSAFSGNQDKKGRRQSAQSATNEEDMERSLLQPTGTHLKYQFAEGSARMLCKVFYSEQFDAVRRKCGVSSRIVESLSRCMKWDSKGGKTKSVFLKTLDDRFVLKSLSPIETQSFLRFAPAYFRLMSETLFHELPSVIAKMVGFYQIIIKNPVTGVEFNWFLLVMENLFYDRADLTRIFDLKGSMRNRRIQSTGEQNEVLLDENMVDLIYESPLFTREHSKKLLRASVWNDTLFLSRQNVMDYSLMVAIDGNRNELVVGIIDCIRTYTWDKRLETWIKDRGKNRPTVTSPKEYKQRFREAMGRYVLMAPNCWHQSRPAQLFDARVMKGDDWVDEKEV